LGPKIISGKGLLVISGNPALLELTITMGAGGGTVD
jgi:hypothetical protein